MEQKQGLNPGLSPTVLACWFAGAQFHSSQVYCSQIEYPTTLILNQNLQYKSIERERERERERDYTFSAIGSLYLRNLKGGNYND
jgi:hypothetical protein